ERTAAGHHLADGERDAPPCGAARAYEMQPLTGVRGYVGLRTPAILRRPRAHREDVVRGRVEHHQPSLWFHGRSMPGGSAHDQCQRSWIRPGPSDVLADKVSQR